MVEQHAQKQGTETPGRGTLHSDMQAFLSEYAARRALDGRTEKAYRGDLNRLGDWLQARGEGRVSGALVEAYLDSLQEEQGAKTSTVMRKYRVFRQYLNYLAHTGRAKSESCIISPPAYREPKPERSRPFTRAETDRLFASIDSYYSALDSDFFRRVCLRDRTMLKLLYYHGIEVSEITSMRVQDYDRKTHILQVHRKKPGPYQEEVFARDLKQDLAGWLDVHTLFERDPACADYLFLSKAGRPLSMQMFVKIFDKYRAMAGIEENTSAKTLKISMQQYAKELMMERCR